MSKYFMFFALLVLMVISPDLMASETSKAELVLNDKVAEFVKRITSTGNVFYNYTVAMLTGLTFLGIAWTVMSWAIKSYKLVDVILFLMITALTWIFFNGYDFFLSEFWSWGDALAGAIQKEVVGNDDASFISSKIGEDLAKIRLKDVSIFGGINAIIMSVLFGLVAMVLEVIVFIISMWHVWGYAFAKVVGLFFIPLAILPFTRGFFSSWAQIFLGFWFFNLFAKVTLSIYYIYFSVLLDVGTKPTVFDPVADGLTLSKIMLHFLIGIVFLLGTGKLASMMANGFGGVVSSAGAGMKQTATKIASLLA